MTLDESCCPNGMEPLPKKQTPAPAAPEKEVLDLLKKKVAWGKEIDKNHLFDYHSIEQMIEEAEQRIQSLRTPSTQEHERGDQR